MKTLQIAVFVTLAVGALLLYRIQQADDSPLVGLLDTMPRQVLKRVLHGPEGLNEEERQVKEELQRALHEQASVDRVVRADGHEFRGRIIDENSRHVKIHQSFGDSGEMTITVARNNIRSVHHADVEIPEISYRDSVSKWSFRNSTCTVARRTPS